MWIKYIHAIIQQAKKKKGNRKKSGLQNYFQTRHTEYWITLTNRKINANLIRIKYQNHYENVYEDPFEWSYTDLFRYERNAIHYYDKQFLFKSQYV